MREQRLRHRHAAFRLVLVAADSGKVEEVKPWVDLLNSVAAADSRAMAARKLLREMQNAGEK